MIAQSPFISQAAISAMCRRDIRGLKVEHACRITKTILRSIVCSLTSVCSLIELSAVAVAQEKPTERQQLILVVGSPGAEQYRPVFAAWAARWEQAAQQSQIDFTKIGTSATSSLATSNSPASGEPPAAADSPTASAETDGDEGQSATDLQRLQAAISSAGQSLSREPLWLVFIGHGTFDGRTGSLNLQGPDITAEQLSELCKPVQRPLAVVICASSSAPFLNALSGPNRTIVTATKDGSQSQYSRFGDAMSQAIGFLDADINRDGQTSLLEAWLFASRRTAEFYKTEGRLATEHSLLDDNGDAQGVRSEIYEGDRIAGNVQNADNIDGRLAARLHLLRSAEEQQLTPEQRQTRDALEEQIESLRKRKTEFDEAEYLHQLESLLVPLAELYETTRLAPPEKQP